MFKLAALNEYINEQIATEDELKMYYKDWGIGQPIVLNHGWPFSAGVFEVKSERT